MFVEISPEVIKPARCDASPSCPQYEEAQNEETEDGGAQLQGTATKPKRKEARKGLYQSFIREGGGKRQRNV